MYLCTYPINLQQCLSFQPPEMRTPLYTVELLYSNPLKWGHLCIQWNSSIPTPWNEDTSVYSGTPLFQPPEMRTPLYTVELPLFQPPEMRTPLYTVELLYSNPLKWGHFCIQWNSSIPTPWNEDTSVYSGTPLFQPLKWGHLCIQWNSSIPTPWNEDTSVYSGTPLFQHPEMRTPLSIPTPWNEDTSVYSGTPLFQPPEMSTPSYDLSQGVCSPLVVLRTLGGLSCTMPTFIYWLNFHLENLLASLIMIPLYNSYLIES